MTTYMPSEEHDMEDQTTAELPLGHEFEPPAGIPMIDPAYDECAHRADANGTLCGEPDGAHDAASAWAYDPNVISWDWKAQPDLDALADLLRPLGVALTKIDTGGDEYAVRVEAAPGMPRTPTEGAAPWIPSMYGDDCPHRPEWTCPEHDECRACECDCNTYVADLEEPDLTLIPADLVVRNPEVCSGRPTMRGTRILASRIAGELAAGTSWEVLYEWYPSMPVPAAQPPAPAPGTVQESTDRGTGGPEAQNSAQAAEDLNSKHWLKWNTIARTITGCQCGFAADVDSDCGFGDSVVAHLLEVGAEAAAPDVDGWSVRLVGGEVVVRRDNDERQLTGWDIPLGAVLAFIADNPLTERTTT